ncbi:hypothetical protein HD553DRAFT_343027 [Filobasidium floriforme]|uniref:uncharacterized protein n=1 Tax=Filobasidium floriforme TaxID=5210 RepID=UPI001E8E557C|nr:uncharacterized protein HD553DRAFT_343027 [Filobasidium floriforme]KAH8083040.1 hypothetical protein HD553DRAFT_343027 [Filobasidium floriforme]
MPSPPPPPAPPPPKTPTKRKTRSSKDDDSGSPSKKAGRKPATGIEHDAKWGYIRVDNWTGPEIAEVYAIQKKKDKLKGWLPQQFEAAWKGGKVDEFNGMLARYAGNWQWCCQHCYDDIPHKDVTPDDYTTWDPYESVFFDHVRFQGMALCRHVVPRPGQSGNLQKSCWYCSGGKGGCTPISHKIQVLFDRAQPVEHRISAGLEVQKTHKMGARTREDLYRETSRLFEQIVVPSLNRHSGFSVEAERGALRKKIAAVVIAGAQAENFSPFEAARKEMNEWKGGVYEPYPEPEELEDDAMNLVTVVPSASKGVA